MMSKYNRIYVYVFVLLGLWGLIQPSTLLAAACTLSPYVGKATLNEFFKDQSNQSNDPDDFVEIKILDSTLTETIFGNWRIQTCERNVPGNNNDGDGCSGYISVGNFTEKTLPWLVLKNGTIGRYVNFKTGFDAVLLDENNYVIDYLTVDSYGGAENQLGCTVPVAQLPYDYASAAPGASDKFIARIPDGTGDWQGTTAASDPPSEDDTNDDAPGGGPAPAISVANVTVSKGNTAVFTLVLAGAPKGYNVTIDFETRDATAVAGTDYVYTSGTASIPAGSSSTTVSVDTIAGSPSGVVYFYLYLSNPVNATVTNHYPTGTILAPPSGEWHMDEASWGGNTDEVTDHSGFDNHGTGKPTPLPYSGPNTTPAFLCNGGEFDGSNDYVEIPHDNTLNGSNQLTYMAWINPDRWSGINQVMSKSVHGGGSGRSQMGIFSESGFLKGRAETVAGRYEITTSLPPTGAWTHIALVFSGTDLRLYLNGMLVGYTSFPATNLVQTTDPLMISKRVGTNQYYFDGLIDEVLVARNAFPASFINQIYNNYAAGLNWDGAARSCAGQTPDHIRLEHDGYGLTCASESITIKACADAACATLFTNAVTVDLTSPVTGWSPDPVSFSGGTATLSLRVTTPSAITLAASATSPAATNPTRCFIGATESCAMTFYDSGFIFNVPDHTADTTQSVIMSAVRKDLTTEQCIPGFQNVSKTVNFWSDYLDPGTGTLAVNVNATNVATASPGTGLSLNFDNNGQTTLQVRYPDVGQMRLNASYTGSGADAGLVMTGTDMFISKPARFALTIPGNPAAADASGAVFKRAGESFTMTVEARNASDAITPNYGREAAAESVALSTSLVAPAGGNNPALIGSFGTFGQDCSGNPATAGTACGTFNWPEVGIITLTPQVADGNYLGAGNVTGTTSSNVGRFIPANFALDHTTSPTCSGNFTYAGLTAPARAGQPFGVTGSVTARNIGGVTTQNYIGSFAKLTAAGITAAPREGAAAAAGTLSWGVDSLNFVSGVGSFAENSAQYAFNAEGVPQTMHLRITATDSDTVTGSQDDVSKAVEYRFGRIRLQNAYGPELLALDVPFQSEYLTAAGYVVSTADGCTAPTLATHLQLSNPDTGGGAWQPGTAAMTVGGGSTSATLTNTPFLGGIGGLSFSAPGAGNTGYVDVRTQIGTDLPWLLYDWDGDGAFDDEATARANFGLYKGSPRHIYLRERY